MLFGALFSTYIILRTGAVEWPHGELNVWLGMANTFILIGSSVTMVMAWASLKLNDFGKHRLYLVATFVLAGDLPRQQILRVRGPLRAGRRAVAQHVPGDLLHADRAARAAHHRRHGGDGCTSSVPARRCGRRTRSSSRTGSNTRVCTGTSSTWCGSSCSRFCTCSRIQNWETACIRTTTIKKSIRTYLMIGAALFVFTGITVAVNQVHLAVPVAVTVALIIATIKGSMVASVFMHLSHEKKWIYGALHPDASSASSCSCACQCFTVMDSIGTPIHVPPAGAHGGPGDTDVSLKAFHLFFIAMSVILAAFIAAWAAGQYRAVHDAGFLATAACLGASRALASTRVSAEDEGFTARRRCACSC